VRGNAVAMGVNICAIGVIVGRSKRLKDGTRGILSVSSTCLFNDFGSLLE
jgi:hypothetical protein